MWHFSLPRWEGGFQFTLMKENFSLLNFSLPRWTRISVYLVLSLPVELHRISIYLDNFSLPGMFSVYRSSCDFSLLQWKCEFQFIPRKNLTWFQFTLLKVRVSVYLGTRTDFSLPRWERGFRFTSTPTVPNWVYPIGLIYLRNSGSEA